MTRQSIGRVARCWWAKRRLPSLTAASVVWCGRPVNTWTAGAPPRCRHTSPHYPGLNCTPATIPLGLLATPEDEKGGVERGREKTREGGGERQVSRRCWRRRRRKNSPDTKKKKTGGRWWRVLVHVLPLHTAKLHPFCTITQSTSRPHKERKQPMRAAGATPIIQRVGRVERWRVWRKTDVEDREREGERENSSFLKRNKKINHRWFIQLARSDFPKTPWRKKKVKSQLLSVSCSPPKGCADSGTKRNHYWAAASTPQRFLRAFSSLPPHITDRNDQIEPQRTCRNNACTLPPTIKE